MKETYTYICYYCQKEYLPTRRKVQKFCSASCRVRDYQEKNKPSASIENNKAVSLEKKQSSPSKPTNHLANIGTAALGILIVNILTKFFTNPKNKPATKKDVQNLVKQINGRRYRPVLNGNPDFEGKLPYFDLETNRVVYETNNLSNSQFL